MPVPSSISDLSETASSNSPSGSEPVGPQANDYFQAAFAFIKQIADGWVKADGSVAMTGPLTLSADPVAALQPVTKQYGDAQYKFVTTGGFVSAAVRFIARSNPNGQGNNIGWNDGGAGESNFVNNQGLGTGGFVFRNVNAGNTVETGRVTFSPTGGITCTSLTVNGATQLNGNLSASGSLNGSSLGITGGANVTGNLAGGAVFDNGQRVWSPNNFNPSSYLTTVAAGQTYATQVALNSTNSNVSSINSALASKFFSLDGRLSPGFAVGNQFIAITVDGQPYSFPINPSDARLKENIRPSEANGTKIINQIELFSFNFKPGGIADPKQEHRLEFIAQQLHAVDETFVHGTPDGEMMMSPNLLPIVAALVKTCQEISAEVAALKVDRDA